MFWFHGFRKSGQSQWRHSYSLSLGSALSELFRLYDQAGGAGPSAGEIIDAWVEHSAAGSPADASGYGRLAQLLRTRDLHEFVTRDPALVDVKVGVLERLLFHSDAASRWNAVRPLLVAALPQLCACTEGAVRNNLESYKRSLSDAHSAVGQLLVLAALFHFDADPEVPPENWTLRFRPGKFPQHDWQTDGRAGTITDWRPADLLCRWEYLAADLLHETLRGVESEAGQHRLTLLRDAGTRDGRKDAPAFTLHCRMERSSGGNAGSQLSLLPVDPAGLLIEVQRGVHRHAGAEGVRQFALLMGCLARLQPGQPTRLNLGEASRCAGEPEGTARQARERSRKLLQVLDLLCQVELQRVEPREQGATVRISRLLTMLGREGRCAEGAAGQEVTLDDPADLTLHVSLDPVFWPGDGSTLADPYRDLSPAVLSVPAREHPLLLGLAAWLPRAWERTWAQAEGVLQRSAQRLFDEAGLWLRESDRYRTAEQLKHDLQRLQELGVLGQWRLVRGGARSVLDHEYRLSAPQRARQRGTGPLTHAAADETSLRQARGWA